MYDIVKTETRKGITFYYARHDEDEDIYVNKLARAENKPYHGSSLPGKMQRLFDATFFTGKDDSTHNIYAALQIRANAAINAAQFYPAGFLEIFSPPPNVSFS